MHLALYYALFRWPKPLQIYISTMTVFAFLHILNLSAITAYLFLVVSPLETKRQRWCLLHYFQHTTFNSDQPSTALNASCCSPHCFVLMSSRFRLWLFCVWSFSCRSSAPRALCHSTIYINLVPEPRFTGTGPLMHGFPLHVCVCTLPMPSWPSSLSPQHKTTPLVTTTQVWLFPAVMAIAETPA